MCAPLARRMGSVLFASYLVTALLESSFPFSTTSSIWGDWSDDATVVVLLLLPLAPGESKLPMMLGAKKNMMPPTRTIAPIAEAAIMPLVLFSTQLGVSKII